MIFTQVSSSGIAIFSFMIFFLVSNKLLLEWHIYCCYGLLHFLINRMSLREGE